MSARKIIKWLIGFVLIGSFFTLSGILIYNYGILEKDIILRVEAIDVGQGASAFITTPYKHHILIDGGPDDLLGEIESRLGFFHNRLDLVVLTHPHQDHVQGLLNVLRKYDITKVWHTGVAFTSPPYLEFLELINDFTLSCDIVGERRIADFVAPSGGDIVFAELLYPVESCAGRTYDNLNLTSIVIQIRYKDTSFLFMGDLEKEGEEELIEYYGNLLDSDVLFVGHHGSNDATSKEFLDLVTPKYAVISVGADNDYGHPGNATLQRLQNSGAEIYRTDIDGNIVFSSNGEEIFVKVEKK